MGAEKFFDIFGRKSGLFPDAVVIVATVRALKMHGGVKKEDLDKENPEAIKVGFANLRKHIENLRKFGLYPIVAINRFTTDTLKELRVVEGQSMCADTEAVITEGWEKGGKGCLNLAQSVLKNIRIKEELNETAQMLYDDNLSLKEKIEKIATSIYGAQDVSYTPEAEAELAKITAWGYGDLPICMAKTQNSISHDKKLLGAPSGYTFPITEIRLSAGAGFVVALSGEINTMPGLPRHPAAMDIDVDDNGVISGLF